MSYKVALRKNDTQEIRFYVSDSNWNDETHFLWTDGNWGCDCNRELFWNRAIEIDFDSVKCSDNRYSALYAELQDGTKIQLD